MQANCLHKFSIFKQGKFKSLLIFFMLLMKIGSTFAQDFTNVKKKYYFLDTCHNQIPNLFIFLGDSLFTTSDINGIVYLPDSLKRITVKKPGCYDTTLVLTGGDTIYLFPVRILLKLVNVREKVNPYKLYKNKLKKAYKIYKKQDTTIYYKVYYYYENVDTSQYEQFEGFIKIRYINGKNTGFYCSVLKYENHLDSMKSHLHILNFIIKHFTLKETIKKKFLKNFYLSSDSSVFFFKNNKFYSEVNVIFHNHKITFSVEALLKKKNFIFSFYSVTNLLIANNAVFIDNVYYRKEKKNKYNMILRLERFPYNKKCNLNKKITYKHFNF